MEEDCLAWIFETSNLPVLKAESEIQAFISAQTRITEKYINNVDPTLNTMSK